MFLVAWGAATYGEWLLLTAVPSYLALSNLGFAAAGSNAAAAVRQDAFAVRGVVRAVWIVVTCTSLLAAGLVLLIFHSTNILDQLKLAIIDRASAEVILLASVLLVLARIQMGILEIPFRAAEKYPAYNYIENCAQLIEFFAVIASLKLHCDPAGVALAMVGARGGMLLSTALYCFFRYPEFIIGVAATIRPVAVSLWKSSLGFLIIPSAQAINNQGFSILIGIFLGPTQLAMFTAFRTLVRLTESILAALFNVLMYEVAYSTGSRERIAKIYRLGTGLASLAAVISFATLIVLAPFVFQIWTRNKLPFSYLAFSVVGFGGLLRSFSAPAAAVLFGLNRTIEYSIIYCIGTVLSIFVGAFFAAKMQNLVGAVSANVITDIVIVIYLVPAASRITDTSLSELVLALPSAIAYVYQKVRFDALI
jgi:O-antigen/teichoic acid export membrane protein